MADANLGSMSPKQRKTLLYGGAGVAALAVVWWVMKRRSSPATVPPDSGFSSATGATGPGQSSLAGYYDPQTGQYITGVGAGSAGTVFGPATNAAWAQQVEAYLVSLGHDAVTTSAALGKYLTGQTMSADQASVVQSALAFFGAPPQSVPPISTAPPGGQSPSSVFYPPAHATGPGVGEAGGYWWTPSTAEAAADFSAAAYASGNNTINLDNRAWFRERIMFSNPQINWGAIDYRDLVNTPLYIPTVLIGGLESAHTEQPWALPAGATLDAPPTYHPPLH